MARTQVHSASGISSITWGIHTEGETFHRFVHLVAPLLGRFYNLDFWTRIVPLAAQSQEQILNATLAITTLYDIPISGAAAISARVSRRYQTAIDWYCRSVEKVGKDDLQGQGDIRSLLISSILYLFAEMRHMDYQNSERLIISAFTIIYSSRFTLWNCKDDVVQASLAMLIDISFSTAIDSSRIPRIHRQCAIILALKISADFKANELQQLKLEAAGMMLDLNDLVSVDGFGEDDWGNDTDMDKRLLRCQQSIMQYHETPGLDIPTQMALVRLEVLYLTCLVRYEDCRAGPSNRKKMEAGLERILDLYGAGARFYSRIQTPVIIDAIEVNFVAGCLFVPWHSRHSSVLPRIRTILNAFVGHSPDLMRQALEYVEILTNTKRTDSTQLELELFGQRPLKTLLYWQQQRCANHLALLSRRPRSGS
ncbi:MAG: hypothetical protein GOMPHAMPRED_006091 [Gomphillus americanus]|uniref:Uncharacterized protein n=1 Tax=Gomphillus americanus TaxID=1940652 RepID=A0A8H3EPJ6_9LECA|nr:MAG: hypothetical protein GOMPHAMPRED_006091 [Gomphillus americanus]